MGKKYIEKDVYTAAIERIKYIFREFDNVLVAFSGGKDSGVCLNLCYDYAKNHGLLGKLAMYHLDYEAQYKMTTDYVDETFKRFSDIRRYWICLPFEAQCCCKMDGGTWTVWEESKQTLWVRPMPTYDYVVNANNVPFSIESGQSDYTVQSNFCKWFSRKNGKTAAVIGIRSDESLHRYCAVSRTDKKSIYDGKSWATIVSDFCVNVYPIYDWTVDDIWTANAKFGYDYNRLYDLYYQAGLGVHEMRVASPFNDCAAATLHLYKVIDPNNWGRMVGRVNGANFTSIYGGTTAMGWKSITLPKGHTWKSYFHFLLGTMPERVRDHYMRIFETSVKYWTVDGGNIDRDTFREMREKNDVKIVAVEQAAKYPHKNKVLFGEYPDDIDVSDFASCPSYKRMCICIMKNDYYCKYAGFGQTKEAYERRRKAIEKYKNL